MRNRAGVRWGVLVLVVALAFGVGCAKKQAVKSTDGAAGAAATAPGSAPAGGITAETVKPEAGMQVAKAEAQAAEAAAATTEEKASPFADIRFDYDKSFIRDDAKPTLTSVAEYMKKNKGAKLLIEGHCDERGTSEYNMALGERRAESAKSYLASLGVAKGALSTVSFGKEKPLDPGHTEDAWAKNRRAHFVLK